MAVPLYTYDLAYRGIIPERRILKLERDGLAKVVRKRTGRIVRAILYRRPDEPEATVLRDYLGTGYSFKHHLDDGHRPWALRPLTGHINRGDESIEFHLAPECVRPIFIRVLLDCMAPAS